MEEYIRSKVALTFSSLSGLEFKHTRFKSNGNYRRENTVDDTSWKVKTIECGNGKKKHKKSKLVLEINSASLYSLKTRLFC